MTKSELKQIVREILKEELAARKTLRESAFTEKDFSWDEHVIVDDFKRAALAYANGANLDDALRDIKIMIISGTCSIIDPIDLKGMFYKECKKYGISKTS